MGVELHGELRRRMPRPSLHHPGVHAELDHGRDGGVTKTVEGQGRIEAGSPDGRGEGALREPPPQHPSAWPLGDQLDAAAPIDGDGQAVPPPLGDGLIDGGFDVRLYVAQDDRDGIDVLGRWSRLRVHAVQDTAGNAVAMGHAGSEGAREGHERVLTPFEHRRNRRSAACSGVDGAAFTRLRSWVRIP